MFYFETNGKTVRTETMPYNVYALAGLQDEQHRGFLTVRVPEGLVPLCNVNGNQYRFKERAGQTFDGKQWDGKPLCANCGHCKPDIGSLCNTCFNYLPVQGWVNKYGFKFNGSQSV